MNLKKILISISLILFIVFTFFTVKNLINLTKFYDDTDKNIYALAEEITASGKNAVGAKLKEESDKLIKLSNDLKNNIADYKTEIEKVFKASEISGIGLIVLDAKNNVIKWQLYNLADGAIQENELNKNTNEQSEFIANINNYKNRYILNRNYYLSNIPFFYYTTSLDNVNFENTTNATIIIYSLLDVQKIMKIIEGLDFGKNGYGIITDENAKIMLHPNPNMNRRNFKEIIKDKYTDLNYNKIEKVFLEKSKVLVEEKDFNSDNQKIITIEFMPDINLFFGAILNKAELGFPFETAKKLWMKFLATLNLTLCGLLGIFLFQKIGCEDFNRRLPVVCGIIAIIFAIGIFSLWYFQRNYGMSSPRLVKNYVSDKGSLNKFIENEKKMVNQNLIPHYSFLPTGILVQSIKISAINEAQISGIVWQKVPKELVGKIKEGVNFPDAVTIQLSEIYRTTDNSGALIIGWSFKAILRQNFESRLFPFEQLNLQVKIDQKNLLDKIKFIPDLDSYDEYTTSSNPFTTRDIVVPGWLVKQTYFTINKSEYSTNFGQSDSNIKNNNSLLTLNIVLQRNFLSNFFSTFLPFFVLLLLAFIALLFSSGMEDKKKLLSFRPSNMQGIASGFLLFLVFSIVNIRRDAISNRLLYIEYLYFFTFFMLLTLVLAVVHISDGRKNFFGYQDGLIIKSIYWPFVFGSIFYITYFIFL